LLIKANAAILSPSQESAPASILVDRTTGKIIEIATGNAEMLTAIPQDVEVCELKDNQVLIPGLVDAHGMY